MCAEPVSHPLFWRHLPCQPWDRCLEAVNSIFTTISNGKHFCYLLLTDGETEQ